MRAALCALLLLACETTRQPPPVPTPSEPSPNASILPAPLASAVEHKARHSLALDGGVLLDAGAEVRVATPRWLHENTALEADLPARELSGMRLSARLRWLDLPAVPRLPETNNDAVQRAREASSFEWTIDLAPTGRMRVQFDSDAFLEPRGSELRARADEFGHVFVWESGSSYTSLPAGSLRAVLSERRLDVVPLAKPKISRAGSGSLLGLPTERSELVTPLGRLLLEQASLPGSGNAGTLLCRLLTELVAAEPANASCERGGVPLRAELFSKAGGHLVFEGVRLERERALEPRDMLVPPAAARFLAGDLPSTMSLLLSADRLRELRNRPLPRAERAEPQAPKQGLFVQNRSDVPRYLLIDGAAVAHVGAHSDLQVDALLPGKYSIGSIDFFGDDATTARVVELPARIVFGDEPETH